jgi:hypothetical protein
MGTQEFPREAPYQGTASAVPQSRKNIRASAPCTLCIPQRLKPLIFELLRHG